MRLELRIIPLDEDVTLVEVEGDIDVATAPMLLQALERLEGRHLLVDLERVSYVDSFGLGTFVKCLKVLRESGGNLRLVHCHRRVERLLSVTGLVCLFELYPDRQAALSSWQPLPGSQGRGA